MAGSRWHVSTCIPGGHLPKEKGEEIETAGVKGMGKMKTLQESFGGRGLEYLSVGGCAASDV